MSNNYIQANKNLADKATNRLHKQHLPADLDTFINLFNQGLINTRNPSIQEIVKLITGGYANIASQSNKIYVKSEDEVVLEQGEFLLNQYKIVAALKRIAKGILEEDYPADTKLIVSVDKPGYIYMEPDVDDLIDDVEDTDNEHSESLSVTDEITAEQNHDAPKDKTFTEKDLELYDGAERFTASKKALPSNLFLAPLIHDYRKDEGTAYMLTGDLAQISTAPVENMKKFVEDTKRIMHTDADYQFADKD